MNGQYYSVCMFFIHETTGQIREVWHWSHFSLCEKSTFLTLSVFFSKEKRSKGGKTEKISSANQSHRLASSSLLLARPRWPWPRSSFHPRSVVLPSTSTILPSLPLFLPSHSITPFLLLLTLFLPDSFAFLIFSLTSSPSGFSSPSFTFVLCLASSLPHPSQLTQTQTNANVIFYLILHAFHFGCHGGESISNMSSLAVWSAGHSSVNVCYVH